MTPAQPRRLTLRRRLVCGIVALLALVTVLIGVFSVLALQEFLVGRLDSQLTAASGRSQDAFEGRPGDTDGSRPPAGEFLALPGQGAGTLAGLVSGNQVTTAAVLDQSGRPISLDAAQLAALAAVRPGAPPVTVDLGPSLGQYRVAMQPPSASGLSLLIGLPLADVQAIVLRLTLLTVVIGVLGVTAAAIAGAVVVRLALRPLERVASTATRVAQLPLDRGDVALAERVRADDADPATEVGQVGAALNTLLEHVASALTARQASENKVRTFVADASHELRTPLASIRGYAELTRRGGHDLPDDVVHAIGRVESESVRMTALVEDLLLLARLDEGAAIEGSVVDVTRLVIDAVSDARAAGPDHRWELELADAAVHAHGDQARLHQVVANLLANARIHTPPGTLVTTAVLAGPTTVAIEVRDTGPGIAPTLTPTIFERFVRGDGSRSRASGSTGLGLAIVTAVVEAHGGRAEVQSTPGSTVFRITLPIGEIT
ncbi:MAG: sensor histidine kinase [Rhodoglobus sp.]